MRIGIDACCWSNKRGFGRFTREILTALLEQKQPHEYFFFADQATVRNAVFPDGATIIAVPTAVSPTEAASASGRRSLSDLWAMTRHVWKVKLDLFFFPAIYSYFPILNRTKIAVTVHDMIPQQFPSEVFPNKKLRVFWKAKQTLAFHQADTIVTVSQYSKNQIVRLGKVDERKVRVLTEGPGDAFHPTADSGVLSRFHLNLGDRYLLHVGGISPHKNLLTLVQALDTLSGEFPDLKLLLVGDYEGDSFFSAYPGLKEQARKLGLESRVIFTGFVEDRDLACLYTAASALVFPSLQEGFGLPAVEAMACGAPVIASNAGSLPEIAGKAGRYFDPQNQDSLIQTLRQVLSDDKLVETMRNAGFEQVRKFSWVEGARRLLEIFEDTR